LIVEISDFWGAKIHSKHDARFKRYLK